MKIRYIKPCLFYQIVPDDPTLISTRIRTHGFGSPAQTGFAAPTLTTSLSRALQQHSSSLFFVSCGGLCGPGGQREGQRQSGTRMSMAVRSTAAAAVQHTLK